MNTRTNRFAQALPRAIMLMAGAFFVVILCILVFFQGSFESYYQNGSLLSNAILLPISLLCAALWIWFMASGNGSSINRKDMWVLAGFQMVLLGVQLIAARAIWFYPGWDIAMVYTSAQELAAGHGLTQAMTEYYQLCPNNAPITVFLSIPLAIGIKLGLAVPYAILPYLGALMLNLTILLCALCLRKLTRNRRQFWSFVLILSLWIGIHMFMTIPYTDIYSLFFAALTLWLCLSELKTFPKWALMTFSCFFGASLKPSLAVFFIALLIIKVIGALGHLRDKAQWKRGLIVLIAIIAGIIPAQIWQYQSTAYLAGSAVPQGQLSTTHYLMLGMNGETMGGHSPDDVVFTSSFGSLKESQAANLNEAWSRFTSRSFAENIHFFAVKAYKAYGDGTFGANTSLLAIETPHRTDSLSLFLRSIFHTNRLLNAVYSTFEQVIWLMLLMLCAYCAIACRKHHPIIPIITLALLGLTLYQLLFEVWPRYLFLFAPFYAIMAATGAYQLSTRLQARLKKK